MKNSMYTYGHTLFEVSLSDGSVVNLIAKSEENAKRLISPLANAAVECVIRKESLN
jgi:hypothetical protein